MAASPPREIEFLIASSKSVDSRNAISLGGDADTQACIAGALAEAFYMNVPKQIKQFVLMRITNETRLGIIS